MCSAIANLLGLNQKDPAPPPRPAAPTPPPVPKPTVTAPVDPPKPPTPGPETVDETKQKAQVTAKKVQKKARALGTSQLAIKKPATGGVNPGGSV